MSIRKGEEHKMVVRGEELLTYALPLETCGGPIGLLETSTGYYLENPCVNPKEPYEYLWVPEATAAYLIRVANTCYNHKTKETTECADTSES
jgi:hypothetical protein